MATVRGTTLHRETSMAPKEQDESNVREAAVGSGVPELSDGGVFGALAGSVKEFEDIVSPTGERWGAQR